MRIIKYFCLSVVFMGCSTLASTESLVTAGPGTIAGAATGTVLKDKAGFIDQAPFIGAGIGAVSGVIAGAQIYQSRVEEAKQSLPKERVAVPAISQEEISYEDALSREMEATKWGRTETKLWSDRYSDSEDGEPYQGDY